MRKAIFFLFSLFPFVIWGQPFSLDTTFQSEHEFYGHTHKLYLGNVGDLLEEGNGAIIAVGGFYFNNTSDIRINVAKLFPNGSIDPSWAPNTFFSGTSFDDIQKNKEVYYIHSGTFGIIRTSSSGDFFDGSTLPLDTNLSGVTFVPYVYPDGRLLAGINGAPYPSFANFQYLLNFMRIKADGFQDTSFHHNTDASVRQVMMYDSTRLLLFGNHLSLYDSIPVNKLCLIDTAGNLDTTFYAESFDWASPTPRYVQPDGKIIVSGRFTLHNYPDTLQVARLNPDGSLDSTFNNFYSSIGGRTAINTVCPTSDGGFLMGGTFTSYQGYPRNRIVKTDSNGFIDLQYFNGEGIDSSKNSANLPGGVTKIVPAQNDKYYVMGHFLKYNGQIVKPLIRILGLSYTVGIEKEADKEILSVFPNPATDFIVFSWNFGHLNQKATLSIYDLAGRKIISHSIITVQGQWIWETQDMNSGVYLYDLHSENQVLVSQGKIVVNL
ncbi:MAG: T9SS type A sorting domain-containing protein [Bacteroidetes bacterium]|nr:T9SS type A sorting domain-containing protein [Bacteroidota bacterium]MCB0841668.1 T9SS type A sorting domain-containing protein [Bacteroidota bacterium]MCB0851026.1 T9SS type A sorting domain-containing protein [Bacteroidota bacterium]